MTLKDISTGPDWLIWVVLVIFALLTLILLTGHGANLIAGYNTSSKEVKSKYNEKKLCRIAGIGLTAITALIFVLAVGEDTLPAATAYIFRVVTLIDCVFMIILMNTVCKK